ncbi:MAG: PD-(D/E)XK nuclease family protein [Chloroflexi bacterium]|nr:MAG: PD-(D/E)XK nuclease family protein [Chloroflexota bacterium]
MHAKIGFSAKRDAISSEDASGLIDQWSYSSLTLFLRNRLAFKKKYILKIYDDKYGPSAIVGQAAHKALELYFKGMDNKTAI